MPCHHPKWLPALAVPILFAIAFLLASQQSPASDTVGETHKEILDLGLEDLLAIEVTSVSKKIQPLSSSPAAIYVITERDIQQSGVTSIPEALRMVPGLHVARIDSNKWAITSRGFNGQLSNKLLVLVDGRAVYSPLFSKVNWEAQDTLLEDIERIEVIRGPGATLWGTNAVNGVINVVTKHSADTVGGLAVAGAGNHEQHLAGLRYGGAIGTNTHVRAYMKDNQREAFDQREGGSANDAWTIQRGGFRIDSELGSDSFTLQGDVYRGTINQTLTLPTLTAPFYNETFIDHADVSGWNVLTLWKRAVSASSEFELKTYYDHTYRDEAYTEERRNTVDIDFQHRIVLNEKNDFLWGLGYNNTRNRLSPSFVLRNLPDKDTIDTFTGFLQNEMMLTDKVTLTLGSKLELLEHSGLQIQPNLRVMWSIDEQHKLWASLSQAIRNPSAGEHDGTLIVSVMPPHNPDANHFPPSALVVNAASKNHEPEEVTAMEIGYRMIPSKIFSLDLSAFYNDYTKLRGYHAGESELAEAPSEAILHSHAYQNQHSGTTRGYEASAVWLPREWWRMDLSYSYLEFAVDISANEANELFGSPPRHQLSLRSTTKLSKTVALNVWGRYVDDVKSAYVGGPAHGERSSHDSSKIDAYTTLDANIVWHPTRSIEVSLVGQNLIDNRHTEFVAEVFVPETEIKRSLYVKVQLTF